MTAEELIAIFEEDNGEHARFGRVLVKRSRHPDIHAFLLLDELVPPTKDLDMIGAATHDQIWLNVDIEALAAVITRDQIIELSRCGVWIDAEHDCLALFA